MAPQEQPDAATMLYMIKTIEQQLAHVQEQLKSYVPIRENEIQLRNIQDTVSRIERDVLTMRTKQETMEREARDSAEKQRLAQDAIEKEARTSAEKQRAALATLQIRVLMSFAGAVVTIITLVIAGFITHFF